MFVFAGWCYGSTKGSRSFEPMLDWLFDKLQTGIIHCKVVTISVPDECDVKL